MPSRTEQPPIRMCLAADHARAVGLRHVSDAAATSRKYYVHPAVLDAYRDGRLWRFMSAHPRVDRPCPRTGLSAEERAVVALIGEAVLAAGKGKRAEPQRRAA